MNLQAAFITSGGPKIVRSSAIAIWTLSFNLRDERCESSSVYCHVTRFTYVLRSTQDDTTQIAAQYMDSNTSFALRKILGLESHELTDEHILQAHLPIRKGGLGLTSAADTAIPAYAGSLALVLKDLAVLDKEFWPSRFKGTFSKANVYDDSNPRFSEQSKMKNTLSYAKSVYVDGREKKKEVSTLYFFPKAEKNSAKERDKKTPAKKEKAFKFPDVSELTKEQTR